MECVAARGGNLSNCQQAWSALTPGERAPYYALMTKEAAKFVADLNEWHQRIPLSPSLYSSDGESLELDSYVESLSDDEQTYLLREHHNETSRRSVAQSWGRYRSDHPKACGGARFKKVPKKPFPFLDLPFELRETIYTMLLVQKRPLVQVQVDDRRVENRRPIDVRIFAVCKQVFAEAVKVFYRINTLSVEINEQISRISHDHDLPLFIRASTGSEAPRPTARLQKVNLSIVFRWPESVRWTEEVWRSVCAVLAKCTKLTEVRIGAGCWREYADDAMDREWDRMLEAATMITGVERVIFPDGRSFFWSEIWRIGTPEKAALVKKIMEAQPT